MKINNLSVLTTDGELLIVNIRYLQLTDNYCRTILKSGCESTEASLELSIKYNVMSLWIYLFLFCIGYLKNVDFLFFVFIVVVSNVESWSRKPLEHLWKSHRLRARQNLTLEKTQSLLLYLFHSTDDFRIFKPESFSGKIYHVCHNGNKMVNAEESWLYN